MGVPEKSKEPKTLKFSTIEANLINDEITEMLNKKAIEIVEPVHNQFVGQIFLRGSSPSFQHKGTQPISRVSAFQDRDHERPAQHAEARGLYGQDRPERCLFFGSNESKLKEIHEVLVERCSLSVPSDGLRPGASTQNIHQVAQTDNCVIEKIRGASYDISRRFDSTKSRPERTPEGFEVSV